MWTCCLQGLVCCSCQRSLCEGDGDVVGVVTPLRGVAQVVLHGVQVVEVGVLLRVHQDGEVRLKNILSHEVRVTRHHEVYNEDCALYVPCSQVQLARVVVRVLVLVDVVCVMLVVLIARVDIRAENVQFSYPFSVVGDVLFTPPVGDSELR